MGDILDQEIGLTLGMINEKNNQYEEQRKANEKEEVIQGDARLLMSM